MCLYSRIEGNRIYTRNIIMGKNTVNPHYNRLIRVTGCTLLTSPLQPNEVVFRCTLHDTLLVHTINKETHNMISLMFYVALLLLFKIVF
jgi:hypothetical protein